MPLAESMICVPTPSNVYRFLSAARSSRHAMSVRAEHPHGPLGVLCPALSGHSSMQSGAPSASKSASSTSQPQTPGSGSSEPLGQTAGASSSNASTLMGAQAQNAQQAQHAQNAATTAGRQ